VRFITRLTTIWEIIPFLLVLAGVSALFSALETAIFLLRSFHVQRLKSTSPDLAGSLEKLMENPRKLLSAILFGGAAANLPLILLCIFLMREAAPRVCPFWIEALLIFAIIVVACELIPKLLALNQPYRIAKIGVGVLAVAMPIFDPITRVLEGWSEKIADRMVPKRVQPQQFLSGEELETLVQLGAEEGALHAAESEMIREIIRLGDKTAKDCMTPRIDAFALPDDLPNEEAIRRMRKERHRRAPVYGDTPDDIVGILDVKTFLFDPGQPYTEVMIPPSFVSETMNALDLLRSFLRRRQGMAVIVDEYGGTEGIVTLADIVEEIISNALPDADSTPYIEELEDGRLLVSGNARLDDLGERLGVNIEEEGLDTIGGLVFNRLGYLPKAGTNLRIGGLFLTVRRTSRKRVEEIGIAREPGKTSQETA